MDEDKVRDMADNVNRLLDAYRTKDKLMMELLMHCRNHLKNPTLPGRDAVIRALDSFLKQRKENEDANRN